MARIKVALPDIFLLTVELPVRITDLNYGAHLGNDALLGLLHEARVQLLAHLDTAELDAATGRGFILADVAVEYKGEAFYGDVLRVQVGVADLSKYGFDVVYHVHNQASKEIARAKTGMLAFDYHARKLRPLPAELIERLSSPSS